MRKVGVVTVARSDYGIYQPILRQIVATDGLELELFVGGMHLSPEFGLTVQEVRRDGFKIQAEIDMLLSSDTPTGVAKSMGLGTVSFAQAYSDSRPDILLVLGDRFEMHSAVCAAVPFRIPIAHIHGGEVTEGSLDDVFRHSITKMSHLHFAATEEYAGRIIQMGEAPWRVMVSGAPGLDNFATVKPVAREELESLLGIELGGTSILVTYHAATNEAGAIEDRIAELLAALDEVEGSLIFTYPNADTGGRLIVRRLEEYVARRATATIVDNLGTERYFSLLKHVDVMVGNSSSGIIEAASFTLPVVNIGSRQQGRARGINVVDVGDTRAEILAGLTRALDPGFRDSLIGMKNIYGTGEAARIIAGRLSDVEIDDKLLQKEFYLPAAELAEEGS